MRAIILSAGSGKRLKLSIPKILVNLGGQTLLEYQLSVLRNYIDEIIVVTGYKHEKIEKMAKKLEFKTVWNPISKITENIVSLACGLEYKPTNEPLIILNGDVLIDKNILKRISKEKGNVLAVEQWKGISETGEVEFYHDYDKEAMKVEVDETGKIINVSKEIGKWESWGEYIGLARIDETEKLRNAVKHLIKHGEVHTWYESAFNVMIKQYESTLRPIPIRGPEVWIEIDTQEDLEMARKLFQSIKRRI